MGKRSSRADISEPVKESLSERMGSWCFRGKEREKEMYKAMERG